MGTNALPTATGGISGRSSNWGTTRSDLDGVPFAALAEEVPAITNDSLRFLAGGEIEVSWRLRDGLKWSDGKPLTATDVEFALAVSPDPRIKEVRVAGPRDITIRFNDRVAKAMETIVPLPKHALEDVFKKGGYEAVREYRRTNVLPASGPYRVVEFVAEDHTFLEPNPAFAGPPPSIKRIEIKKYANDAALVAAFEAKEIDMIAPNAISPEAAAALAKKLPKAVTVRPSELLMFLHPDMENPLLAKQEVRKALLTAFDRARMAKEVFGEGAKVATIPVTGDVPKGAEVTAYDAEAAKTALEKAGAAGATIPLFHGDKPVDKAMAAELVRDALAVGITLQPKEDPKISDLYRKRKHGGLLLTQTTGERDSEPEKYWAVIQKDGRYDRAFRSPAFDDDMLALVKREERALYPERREQIRDMLFVEVTKRLPLLPLVFLTDVIVADPSLDGWQAGSGVNFGTTTERWYFRE
ncbi:MAG: ABC transporter substrate-binding protein [Myxococcales bacterium]|nr:ABC transporter substrate-binding protein [Myxococcales bacterium]